MAVKKVYYDGKCIMTVDMDYAQEDSIREYLNEIEEDSIERKIEKGLREVEQLFCAMKEILNADEFELFKKLRNEEVHCLNDLETKFFAGNGCLDYVWVEYNGEKESRL